jgi:4a-hydroxytetrahydrobiopterin dehydratase
MNLLSSDEAKDKLNKYTDWQFEKDKIIKEFQFKDFKEALEFINNIAVDAEQMNHHPDIFLHSWNKVKLTLSTHSEGGITSKDISLAEKIEGHRN